MAGGGLEGRRGEADQIEAGHHGGEPAEPAVERRGQVKVVACRQSTSPVRIGASEERKASDAETVAMGMASRATHLMPHRFTTVKSQDDGDGDGFDRKARANTIAGWPRRRAARSGRRSEPSPTSSRCRSGPRARDCRAETPRRRRRRCRRRGLATSGSSSVQAGAAAQPSSTPRISNGTAALPWPRMSP